MRAAAPTLLILLLLTAGALAAEEGSEATEVNLAVAGTTPDHTSLVASEPVSAESADVAVTLVAPQAEAADARVAEEPAPDEESGLDNSAGQQKKVYVYENGCPVNYATDEEWEFHDVERQDIRSGNWALLKEVNVCGDAGALTLGAAYKSGDTDPQLALTGSVPDGPIAAGDWRQRVNRAGDWQELRFDYANRDSYSADYNRDTLRHNWDISSFTRNGNVWALRSDDESDPDDHTWEAGSRDRTQTALNFRNGSAAGGSWRMNLRHYDTEIGATTPPQVDDSRLTRFEVEGRLVECRTTLEGAAFAGSYRSQRALLDNDFSGVRFDGSQWLGDRVELQADGGLTRIDAGIQDASATRSDYSAQLGWDMNCDVRLSAFARGYSDDSDISAGSTLRSYSDTGARLDYRPDGNTALSAALTSRDVATERLMLEDRAIVPFLIQFDPVPNREDLAGLRANHKASGTLLDINARHRFNCRFYTGASYHAQDFRTLPPAADILADELDDHFYADRRAQASLHAAYDLCDIGNVTFRADTDQRNNSARGSSFGRDQYTLGYSAPLCKATRLGLGITRQTTAIDTTDVDNNFDGSGWNYALNLAGESHCTSYVISANRAASDGHAGGDLNALGLELSFDSPWRVSAWWRQFEDFLGGRNAEDVGVQVGYRIEL